MTGCGVYVCRVPATIVVVAHNCAIRNLNFHNESATTLSAYVSVQFLSLLPSLPLRPHMRLCQFIPISWGEEKKHRKDLYTHLHARSQEKPERTTEKNTRGTQRTSNTKNSNSTAMTDPKTPTQKISCSRYDTNATRTTLSPRRRCVICGRNNTWWRLPCSRVSPQH